MSTARASICAVGVGIDFQNTPVSLKKPQMTPAAAAINFI